VECARGLQDCLRRKEEPGPVSGAGSPTLRGLFHPNANTVADDSCGVVSGMLNLNEIEINSLKELVPASRAPLPPLCEYERG
jgi:hypothetical protein